MQNVPLSLYIAADKTPPSEELDELIPTSSVHCHLIHQLPGRETTAVKMSSSLAPECNEVKEYVAVFRAVGFLECSHQFCSVVGKP
jgi:hypothetical protein